MVVGNVWLNGRRLETDMLEKVMLIDAVYDTHGLAVVGRLNRDVNVGDLVELGGEQTEIIDIMMYGRSLTKAVEGQTCGLRLRELKERPAVGSELAVSESRGSE
jgi:translation elongation factor EF-Tu-like GTPase